MSASLASLAATACAAADAAGPVSRALFRAPALAAETKADLSPVTIADRRAEAAMRAAIRARHPSHAVFGEESGFGGGGIADGDGHLWVLDPIDGTRAFITGRPVFGSLVALLRDGRPVVGVIDQPVTGERWVGVAGEPTRFTGPFGGAVGGRACAGLGAAELSATAPEMFDPAERAAFERLRGAVRRNLWGGDCYAYGLLALGLVDVIAEAGMRLWDWAALAPVVEGAGGAIAGWDGRRLAPLDLARPGEAAYRVLAVGDKGLLAAAAALLDPSSHSPDGSGWL